MQTKQLLLAGILTINAFSAYANLITNGSFESPKLTPGSDYAVATVGSATIPHWTVVGPINKSVAIVEALYDRPDGFGFNLAASDGVQYIDLTGVAMNSYEGLEQIVSLAADSYTLSFDVGNVVTSGPLGFQSTVDLWINGGKVQSFTNSGSGGTAINWQQYSYTFAGNGLTTIGFRNADATNDNFNGLDNVYLSANSVPEPAVGTLLIVGILVIGLKFRQRGWVQH